MTGVRVVMENLNEETYTSANGWRGKSCYRITLLIEDV